MTTVRYPLSSELAVQEASATCNLPGWRPRVVLGTRSRSMRRSNERGFFPRHPDVSEELRPHRSHPRPARSSLDAAAALWALRLHEQLPDTADCAGHAKKGVDRMLLDNVHHRTKRHSVGVIPLGICF